MSLNAQQLILLQQQIIGIGGGGLLSDPNIVGVIQRIQQALELILLCLQQLGNDAGPTGPAGATGPTGAGGTGPTGPTGPAGGGGGACDVNTTATKGPGVFTILATDITTVTTAFDEIIVPVAGGSGFGSVLSIAADPGGATAYTIGARITLNINTAGVAIDSTLDYRGPVSALLGGLNFWSQPEIAGSSLDSHWQFILKYCGSDLWMLDGQQTATTVI